MFDELTIVDPVSNDTMLISWDLGRRCNFDCSYCPPHRHDNVSDYASFEELKKTAEFMFDYLSVLMPYREAKYVSVSFTGGEPTANPSFVKFGIWLKEKYLLCYQDQYHFSINLTTNGAFGREMRDNLIRNFDFSTISYHCEGSEDLKKKVVDNIFYLSEYKFKLKVNVMFHAREDYFNECVKLCEQLDKKGITYIPRMIGEHENKKYAHRYTKKQIEWMESFWNKGKCSKKNVLKEKKVELENQEKNNDLKELKKEEKALARTLGRPCCGNREMNVCGSDGKTWEKTSFLKFANFKNWYCSVNWFFLHIEQQTGQVFHHQTCQATFNGGRGAIGHLNESVKIIEKLRSQISDGEMPVIVCPNNLCGCGLCTPKAKNLNDFKKILPRYADQKIFTIYKK